MKKIVYVCPFVPAEWIAAHGMQASRLLVGSTTRLSSAGIPSGVCPFVRSFASRVVSETEAAGIVVTTICDQMRRMAELIVRDSAVPVFVMNVPSTWQTDTAQKLYMAELQRLGRFMLRLGGNSPTGEELAKVMIDYDAARSAVRDARAGMSSRQYSEAIARFNSGERSMAIHEGAVSAQRGVAVVLVGGPLMANHFTLFEWIEKAGGNVVLDGMETGERTLPAAFDRRRLGDDPFMELADAYFGAIPDVFRRPNSELYRWLKREIVERGIRGIIVRRYVWCDGWHAEVHRMREWAEVPLLDLDVGDDDNEGRTMSRIESFLAMLK